MKRFLKKVSSRVVSSEREDANNPGLASAAASATSSTPRDSTPKLGLVLLADGNNQRDQEVIDIIAIHGLNGHPENTWTHPNGTFWLKDLLPEAFPNARIFTYGYPSVVAFTTSRATLRDYSLALLNDIETYSNKQNRPIIYICHSLGGVVIKQAMILADERRSEFENAWRNSKAIIFMGTPHGGSTIAEHGYIISRVFDMALRASGTDRFAGSINTALVQNLRPHSEQLKGISQAFASQANRFHIASFYETENLPYTNDLVVQQSSAVLNIPLERERPLYLHHRDLCRFSGKNDRNYLAVSHMIKDFAGLVLKSVKNPSPSLTTNQSYDTDEKLCLSILNSVDVSGYQARLQGPATGTLSWVPTNSHYLDWVSSPKPEMLWIFGYPGCGKTTIAAYITSYLSRSSQSERALVCTFFCDDKIQGQRNGVSILQSLVFQIISRQRRLVRIVRRFSDEGGIRVLRQFDALWNLFIRLIDEEPAPQMSVVIDALDECDQESQLQLVSRIYEVLEAGTVRRTVKFLLTSRPDTALFFSSTMTLSRMVRLDLDEYQSIIGKDIVTLIRSRLGNLVKRGVCKPHTSVMLEETLCAKAGHTFLWVDLVLKSIERRRMILPNDVEKLAHLMPSGLISAYEQLLDAIPQDDRFLASRMLRIITVASRPLSWRELATILTIDESINSASQLDDENLIVSRENIKAVLGPLIRMSDTTIELVHQSLKDFLIDLDTQQENKLSGVFGVHLARDSVILVSACLMYLHLEEFNEDVFFPSAPDKEDQSPVLPRSSVSSNSSLNSLIPFDLQLDEVFDDKSTTTDDLCDSVRTRFSLFDYASMFWTNDLLKCRESDISSVLHESAINLCPEGQPRTSNWQKYFWYRKYFEPRPGTWDALDALAYYGLAATMKFHFDNGPLNLDYQASKAAVWASREGHLQCLDVLVGHPTFNAKLATDFGHTPLSAAASYGHTICLSMLLKGKDFDPNHRDSSGRTPLSLAAGNGNFDMVRILLENTRVEVNEPDKSNATPLFWAVLGGSPSVADAFLKHELVDVKHLDRHNRSALSWAAEEGSEEIVSRLIRTGKFDVRQKDVKGRTALSYAIWTGRLEVVKLLIRNNKASISDCDNDGRNSVSLAASQREGEILRYIVKHGKEATAVADINGWLPIHWALDPPGYPENVFTLLSVSSVDINFRDNVYERTVLSWACAYGHVGIVRELVLLDGIDIEAKDSDGRTALSYAAAYGEVEVLASLVEKGAFITAEDKFGRCALHWAVIEGQLTATQFLMFRDNISRGQTNYSELLSIAREHRRFEIEALLVENMERSDGSSLPTLI